MPNNDSISELKSEISWYYLEELKKELGWLKSLTLLPIEEKVKNLIIGNWELPDKFNEIKEFWWWKDIINFVTPSTAKQILKFMKEKREEIVKRTTAQELAELRDEILHKKSNKNNNWNNPENNNWNNPENNNWNDRHNENVDVNINNPENNNENEESSDNAVIISVWAWSGWAVAVKAWEKWIIKVKDRVTLSNVAESLDGKKMKKTVESLLEATEKQKSALIWQLSNKQIANIDKQIAHIRSGLSDFSDDWISIFKEWQQLWDKLPIEVLDKMWLSNENIKLLKKYSEELSQFDDIDDIKDFLKNTDELKWINIDEDFLKALVKAEGKEEVECMLKIAWNNRVLKNIAKTIWWALVLDVAFFWFDIWSFIETRKEAELIAKVNAIRADNKYKQANRQLAIWAASVLAEVILWCAMWGSAVWPVWTIIWLAVWVIFAGISIWVDSLYFDVQDFYLQNKDDFIRETKSQINQAILQWLYNQSEGNTSINEFLWAPNLYQRIKCTKDAIRASIFLDELENWQFKWNSLLDKYIRSWKNKPQFEDSLSSDSERDKFRELWTSINEEIEKRTQYIENSRTWIIDKLKWWEWIHALDNIVRESRIYARLDGDNKWDNSKNYNDNLQSYKQEFFKDVDQEKLNKIEELKVSKPELYQEIIATTDAQILIWTIWDEELWDNDIPEYWETNADEYFKLRDYVNVITKYQEWLELTQTDSEKIRLKVWCLDRHYHFIQELLIKDLNVDEVDMYYTGWWDETVIDSMYCGYERSWEMEISDDPLQNVLYRLWKELYWYTWNNKKSEIMDFYDEWHDWIHWIYFSDKRKVNEDWATDWALIVQDMKWPFVSEEAINTYIDNFVKYNFKNKTTDDYWNIFYYDKSIIDTQTENIDWLLQKEFEEKIKSLLKEELSYRLKDNIESTKQEIIDFVKEHREEDDEYFIKLPYYLVLKARKAWLWDLQQLSFKWNADRNKMEVCWLPYDSFTTELPFDENQIIRSYVSSYRKIWNEWCNAPLDSFTDEEKFYIDRVERAHKLLENLRSCEWFRTKEDELDLPTDVEHLISEKYIERERFKRNLLVRWPDYACWMDVIEKYKEFAEYFENLYRWLLLMETTFVMSNDVDKFEYYKNALSRWSQNYFDDKWKLKTDTGLDFINNEEIRAFYEEQIKTQKVKVWDKEMIIQEIWDIEEPWEDSDMSKPEYQKLKDVALQASNVILTALLEESMLEKNENWNITWVKIWWHRFDSDKNDSVDWDKAKKKTAELIEKRLKFLDISPQIIREKVENKKWKEQEIIRLKNSDVDAIKKSIEIENKIKNTLPNVDWRWKRWEIVYDPEKSVIRSRDNEVSIEVKEENWKYIFYMKHLGIWFEKVEDFVWMANFRNWVLYEDKVKHIWTDITFWLDPNSFSSKATFIRWTTTLISRDDLINNCSICEDDNVMKILTDWLNHEMRGYNTWFEEDGWEGNWRKREEEPEDPTEHPVD